MADNSILIRLDGLKLKYEEIGQKLTDPEIIADVKQFVQLTKEYKELEPIIETSDRFRTALREDGAQGSCDTNSICTQCQCLEGIVACFNTAVGNDQHVSAHSLTHFRQNCQWRHRPREHILVVA